ncbi:MAG: hypothetical protein JJE39_04630 [Vicinamibacteria bacterium]|nr:hypothetical protein [Vicinamibacteria bacterium]
MINVGVGLLIAALPYLISGVASAADFPSTLSFLLFPGRGLLVLLGGLVVLWAALRDRVPTDRLGLSLEFLTSRRGFSLTAFAIIAIIAFARVPQEEKEAEAFGGDEPKYLRIAYSLLRDTDADVSGGRTETPGPSVRMQQVWNLLVVGRDSAADLFKPVEIPDGHVWNAGNWTVRGLNGGLYHLQPPGLPALVAAALAIGEGALPNRDPGIYVAALLSLIWLLGARELWRLSLEATNDSLGSAIFVALVLLSAPVFVGGYQLFPESLSLLLFPWLFRRLRTSDRPLSLMTGLVCGLLTGSLLWVHPKLTIVAALFAVMAWLRPRTSGRVKLLFTLGLTLTTLTSLLYCFHISGLFRPEGLYIRQAEEYVGSPNPLSLRFAAGLVKSLAGGRDGLLVFAPVLVLAFMTPMVLKRPARSTIEMWSLFLVVWLTSAVHDGASLGSPARLMAPAAFVPAFFLTRALREHPPASFKMAAVFLFLLGTQITETVWGDWRRNVNPYRTMFANPSTNFEASLPGNSFAEDGYRADLRKAGLVLVTLLILAAGFGRARADTRPDLAPARFGTGVMATLAFLAYGLHWLGPP